jgi:wyosine [tRNA(Phe)-imidazoG37] synthetase (radical SAM superfamily)
MDKSLNASKYIFGPVPSRRLGRSLGVDLVPYKTCTFDCIYCDLGRTTCKTVSRQSYVASDDVERELDFSLPALEKKTDYITLSGSGEPTLNQNIKDIIHSIKGSTSLPLAVLTNGSLLFMEEVRDDLMEADIVLPSLDAVTPFIFDHINRPHPSLRIEEIISGLVQFRKQFRGQIWLEILFCRGINDDKEEIGKLKKVIERIQPDRVQLNTSVRPPVEEFAFPLTLNQLEEIRERMGGKAEIVPDFPKPFDEEFDSVKDTEILNLIKRRPCTAEDVSNALGLHLDEVVKYLEKLLEEGVVYCRMYEHRYYYEIVLSRVI